MKLNFKLLYLPFLALALAGCGSDEDDDEIIDDGPTTEGSYDGKVTQLLKHKVGKGVPIVIMGDGFVDKQIKEGKYRKATSGAVDVLFSVYPMSALKDYFDVYEVTTVSNNDYATFWTNLQDGIFTSDTALGVKIAREFGNGSWISSISAGDEKKIVRYAEKAIGEDRIDDATIVVLINDTFTEGLSRYIDGYNASPRDIPTGAAISYVTTMHMTADPFALPPDDFDYSYTFETTLACEFGHSFAKLAYESYVEDNKISNSEISILRDYQSRGYDSNISLSSDVTKTPWADFAADSRYDFEDLGCYEGADLYSQGVYRATFESAMCGWGSTFNVAERSMIYKRCMNIAYGDSWKYNYEDFVKFDLDKAKAWKAAHPGYAYSKSKALSARKVNSVKVPRR